METTEVIEYEALYTTHIKQKHKVWHDGTIKIETPSNGTRLLDDEGRLLAEGWPTKPVAPGKFLRIEQFLIDVGDIVSRRSNVRPLLAAPIVQGTKTLQRASYTGSPRKLTKDSTDLIHIIQTAESVRKLQKLGNKPSLSTKQTAENSCAQIRSFRIVPSKDPPVALSDRLKPSVSTLPEPEHDLTTEQALYDHFDKDKAPTSPLSQVYGEQSSPERPFFLNEPDSGPWSSEAYMLLRWRPPADGKPS